MMGVTGASWAEAASVAWFGGEVGLAGGGVRITEPWEDVGEG